jgi:hypothetical protein
MTAESITLQNLFVHLIPQENIQASPGGQPGALRRSVNLRTSTPPPHSGILIHSPGEVVGREHFVWPLPTRESNEHDV